MDGLLPRAGEIDGLSPWRWRAEAFYAATRDVDQLLFVGVCLYRITAGCGDRS